MALREILKNDTSSGFQHELSNKIYNKEEEKAE
jgi:hypothetical protein